MAFRATLVAFGEDAAAAPFLGHQFTEIALSEPTGQDASNPAAVGIVARDRIIEATDGQDTAVTMRKMSDVEFAIDFVNASTKARLERLSHDGRAIYICPNVGPSTRWSLPLQRGLADFAGRKTMGNGRTGIEYCWDETEKVFRSWAAGETPIDFNGRWTRYLRAQEGHANKAAYPHPTSGGHGWSVYLGTATLTYTEEILSPVLRQRTITNQKGVVTCYANGGVACIIQHSSAATLSTTYSVTASICAAWTGDALFMLLGTASGTVVASTTVTGDGTFKLVKLGAANSLAANQYTVRILLVDSGTKKQAMIIGPTLIANAIGTAAIPDVEDWNDGTVSNDNISSSDSNDHILTDFTFSCFLRWSYYQAGVVLLGPSTFQAYKTAYDALVVNSLGATSPMVFSNVQATLGVSGGWNTGDWIHFVLRGSITNGIGLWVNGSPHSLNGTEAWEPADYGSNFRVGWYLPSGGMSHARLDATAWTQQQITDHYHTYFEDRGRGIVEPLFGKVYAIEELRLSPRGSSPIQWVGTLALRELGADDRFAPMLRQEGDV